MATYTITNPWPGGFGASVTVRNSGTSAITGWTVRWTWANGQTVTQLWNGVHSASGAQQTVVNAGYNGNLNPNGTTTFGFNASQSGTNPIPAVTCTPA